MKILFLFLFIIPLIELYFLIQLGEEIGALPTVLLTIFTAVAGVALMRMQGLAVMQKAQQAMASGEPPTAAMLEGVFIFLGGIFLFFPGLISDGLGFLFLIPFVRQFFIGQSIKGMKSTGRFHYKGQKGEYYEGEWSEGVAKEHKRLDGDVIEGEVLDKDAARKD
ncbi:MAG: UPF0716 protein FxsA [Thiomicrorhabdus sp.]|nr:MAG: UPF0716 protein FxsA [Thiomicrorhabdus sp.]